ncbi:MAG: hypothetical protein OSB68_08330 [Dehalococcoidia bacterium]|nr:hypothetical protein [Dehalococcoidia bacterium]
MWKRDYLLDVGDGIVGVDSVTPVPGTLVGMFSELFLDYIDAWPGAIWDWVIAVDWADYFCDGCNFSWFEVDRGLFGATGLPFKAFGFLMRQRPCKFTGLIEPVEKIFIFSDAIAVQQHVFSL